MAAPSINPQELRIYGPGTATGTVQMTAPLIGGAITPPIFSTGTDNLSSGFRPNNVAAGSRYGGRLNFSVAIDFTAYKWFAMRSSYNEFGLSVKLETLQNGGISTIFVDSLGNWAEFYWHGNGWDNRDASRGGWQAFNSGSGSAAVLIDITATPDASSGTIDWSDVVALEQHVRFAISDNISEIFYGLYSINNGWAIINGEAGQKANFGVLADYIENAGNSFNYYQAFRNLTRNYDGQIGAAYTCRGDVQVGDGSTLTEFSETGFSLSFYPTRDNDAGNISDTNDGSLPHTVAPSDSRFFKVVQSSNDDVEFINGRWSGYDTVGGDWAWSCEGNAAGNCLVSGCSIFRARDVAVSHADFRGVSLVDCDQVSVTLASSMIRCALSSSAGKGLYVTAGPGDYSNLNVSIEDETASVHVTIADGAAGTYDLTGLTDVGQTVVFHNESASSAVTIQVNEDFGPTSTTTAGGAITVEVVAPPAVASVTGIVDGSRLRIYNVTQDVETFNDIVSGATSYSQSYTTGTTYANGDVIRVYLTYQNGTSAKLGFQATAVASSTGWAVLADQQDDDVYGLNSIDGSSVTKFAADYGGVEIDISAASNFTSQEFYAWWVYNLTTEQGIRNFFGGYIAEDAANYRNNVGVVSIYWDNLTTTNVYQTDSARIYRSDGQRPVKNGGATTGGGGVDINWREKVFLATTGSGPLTPTQEARLLACATEAKQDTILSEIADLPVDVDTELSSNHGAGSWTGSGGSGGDDAATIYTYFTTAGREDAFKADVSEIPTNPLLDDDARIDNLDVAVSSRLANGDYIAPDNAGIAAIPTNPLLANDSRLGNLANVDVAVSTRLAAASYVTPPTVGQISTQLNSDGFSKFNSAVDTVRVGFIGNNLITASTIASNAFGTAAFTSGFFVEMQNRAGAAIDDYAPPTLLQMNAAFSSLTAHGDSQWVTATGFSTLTGADVVSALNSYGAATYGEVSYLFAMQEDHGDNNWATDNTLITNMAATIDLIRKYVDNDTALVTSDGVTPAIALNAAFIITYDDDGVTPIKTVRILGTDGNPALMPSWSRYEKL